MLPLAFKRIGVDPGIASSPFVATFVDVTGIVIYFSIAKSVLSGLGDVTFSRTHLPGSQHPCVTRSKTFEGWEHERVCRFVGQLGYQGLGAVPFTLASLITDERRSGAASCVSMPRPTASASSVCTGCWPKRQDCS